jgi:hypothetical protein
MAICTSFSARLKAWSGRIRSFFQAEICARVVRVQVQALAQDLPDQVVAVGGIEDGEAGLQAHMAVFAAQDVEAQVVEGGHGQALAFAFLQADRWRARASPGPPCW